MAAITVLLIAFLYAMYELLGLLYREFLSQSVHFKDPH